MVECLKIKILTHLISHQLPIEEFEPPEPIILDSVDVEVLIDKGSTYGPQ